MEKQLKIFLATDYSESVKSAERYAVQFAERTKAFLTVLHVYTVPFSFPSEPAQYAFATDKLRKSELLRLKLHFNDLIKSLGATILAENFECVVLEGPVGKQINKEAENAHMDFIITGTHEAAGFRKLFGSHTWDIIKKSQIPVLSIPKDTLMCDIKKIVFATDYRKGEIPGIGFLVKLAAFFKAELTILHISNDALSIKFEKELMENFLETIQKEVQYDKINLQLAHYSDVVEGLNKHCLATNTDWLVLSHAKTFFLEKLIMPSKSITKEMSFQSQIPLLAIPDYYSAPTEEN